MPKKSCRLEELKLSKKQLATPTQMDSMGIIMTIGDLNIRQLRVLLYEAYQTQKACNRALVQVRSVIEDVLP